MPRIICPKIPACNCNRAIVPGRGKIIIGESEQRNFAHQFELQVTLDDWVDDFLLAEIMLLGYPPIPRTRDAYLVAVRGDINAVVDRYDGVKHPHCWGLH